jgi:hypothetical protein
LLSLVAATTCHIFKQPNVSYSLDAFFHNGEKAWLGIVATGIPVPDGLFMLSDALVIQRKALELISF